MYGWMLHLAVHGRPRATGALDIWVDATPTSASVVVAALRQYGAPLSGVSETDFERPGIVFQMGLPPLRIGVLTQLSGITFVEAWPERTQADFGLVAVDVIGRDAFIKNKRATGRARDLGDIESLGRRAGRVERADLVPYEVAGKLGVDGMSDESASQLTTAPRGRPRLTHSDGRSRR